jgi:hypothetical protein
MYKACIDIHVYGKGCTVIDRMIVPIPVGY